jgi:hypothetical protein
MTFLRPFETVTDLDAGAEILRERRYGVIEVVDGRLKCVRLRPLAKRVSLLESEVWGRWFHGHRAGDRCWLYYNQSCRLMSFLSLVYVVSARDTTFRSFRQAVTTLDEIAQIKGADAILCDASNARISDRLLARWGWVPHAPMPWRRNFIKRLTVPWSWEDATREIASVEPECIGG